MGDIITADRRITWDPGIRGGRPTDRTQSGSTLATSSTTAQIQTALNNAASGTYVLLASGVFTLTATLTIPSNVTLRGAGLGVTILQGAAPASFSGNTAIQFNNSFDSGWGAPIKNLVSPQKDDTTITTTAAHGWSTGDIVLIDSIEQPSGDPVVSNSGSLGEATWVGRDSGTRCWGQWVKIQSTPTSTTATIDPPLYYGWPNTPQGVEMTGITNYAGVEDLTVDVSTTAATGSDARDIIGWFGAINCWLYNVELKGIYRYSNWVYGALWCEINHCTIHDGIPVGTDKTAAYDSSRTYGMFFGPHATACLITDNIIEKATMGWSREGVVSGCVFSYNLVHEIWWKNTGDSPRRFTSLGHGPHPMFCLDEGNWLEGRIRADEYWGSSSHNTFLRNRVVEINRGADPAQCWTVDIERIQHYYNFVGNVIGGDTGITGSAQVEEVIAELINGESAPYDSPNAAIWKIGYESLGEGATNYDTAALSTMLRWRNWQFRAADGVAGSGIVDFPANVGDTGNTTVPNSYYLSSKPESFGVLPWPPYQVTDVTEVSMEDIPAGYRYVHGVDPPQDADVTVNTTNLTATNLVIG